MPSLTQFSQQQTNQYIKDTFPAGAENTQKTL